MSEILFAVIATGSILLIGFVGCVVWSYWMAGIIADSVEVV